MSTRERMRRELKELAKMGETLRQERSEDEHASGKWSYVAPEAEESATDTLHEAAAPSARPSRVSVPPPGPWASAPSSPDGMGSGDAGSLTPHRAEPSPRKWLLGLGAAAFLIGASLFGRTFAESHPPTEPAIVIATQAPAPPPSPTPASAPASERAMPAPEATVPLSVGLYTGPTPPSPSPPATADSATPRSALTAPPIRPDAARPPPKASAKPTTPPRPPAPANHPAPTAPAPSQSLDDMIRNAVRGSGEK